MQNWVRGKDTGIANLKLRRTVVMVEEVNRKTKEVKNKSSCLNNQ